MPLGLFPASLSTDLLLILSIVRRDHTNKIETVGDLKARERKGLALGIEKYILFCARFAATVTSALALARSLSHARSRALAPARLKKITFCKK